MANIGDQLPYGFRVAATDGSINKPGINLMVAPTDGSINKQVIGIFIAPAFGAINKRVYIGGGRLGDVDNSGGISISDYTYVGLHINGQRILTAEEYYRADVNQDGVINETDLNLIRDYIMGGGS